MITLRKVRVDDIEPIVRAIYAEETEAFLNQYHQQGGNGLDACVFKTVENIGIDRFFKIENEHCALVGFFTTGSENGIDAMASFHVRQIFRSSEYLQAFWNLIQETFNNTFFTSVGAANMPALAHLLKNDFTIVNKQEYEGKNFLILKSPITK